MTQNSYSNQPQFFCGHIAVLCLLTAFVFILSQKTIYASDVTGLLIQGTEYSDNGELDQAISVFKEAVRLDPNNEYAHNQLGILYGKKGDFDNAFEEFTLVVDLDNQNTFALLWIGILHLRNGQMNSAIEMFNKIIKIDSFNANAYYFMGAIYNFRHNPVMAIEYLKKARDVDADDADTHFRLAKAFHNVDMIANALLEYTRTLEINPSYVQAINGVGWIYYNRGDTEQAIDQWKKALKINPNDRDAALNLAKCYNDLAWSALKNEKMDEAKQNWKRALAINPGNKAATYYMKQYGSK